MEEIRQIGFDKREPGEEIFWVQDAKTDTPFQTIAAGCLATAKYQGTNTMIRILRVEDHSVVGVVVGHDPPERETAWDLNLGDHVEMKTEQVVSCSCSIVS